MRAHDIVVHLEHRCVESETFPTPASMARYIRWLSENWSRFSEAEHGVLLSMGALAFHHLLSDEWGASAV
ncbi:hypothetical protein OVY01_12100 [Robbsia sp. Bb-Pol-6]|uniref:Uncharacterized protein n=1 Tax=Robbsia betulipollinis TaxID=2981849 RepID=A0ABT3ZPW8_9BURK|nr:hypothetical protein [Robbsia betulipollinis]MCY0387965.1 hypothetical protein [Robbsia betulipollinis]